jgi:SAM-dependent methyltransferase
VLKAFQIDALAFEADSFGLQQKALFESILAGHGNASAGADDALPGQSPDLPQDLAYCAGVARVAGRFGDGSVSTDTTAGNPPNSIADGWDHGLLGDSFARHRPGYDIIFPDMTETSRNPESRFSDRAEDYARYRPRYPHDVVHALRTTCDLQPAHVLADIGCGPGMLAEIFLENGNRVIGVEPNREMRIAGEKYLAGYPNFRMVDGSAEATTLDRHAVDFAVAGQAFHWFRPAEARTEFARILKPGGWAVLVWNDRGAEATAFLRDYEAFVRRHSTDYEQVTHKYLSSYEALQRFFAPNEMKLIKQHNQQSLDFDGLRGRLLSSSYIPKSGEKYDAMLRELPQMFSSHAVDGRVALEYDTKIYCGHLDR